MTNFRRGCLFSSRSWSEAHGLPVFRWGSACCITSAPTVGRFLLGLCMLHYQRTNCWPSLAGALHATLPAHQLYHIGLEYHWGSALPVLKSVISTWMGDHPVGQKNYPKLFLTKNFYRNNFFSCDEQLKKWCCHSVRSFVRLLYPYF